MKHTKESIYSYVPEEDDELPYIYKQTHEYSYGNYNYNLSFNEATSMMYEYYAAGCSKWYHITESEFDTQEKT